MKIPSRVSSLILAIILVFSLTPTAFASTPYTDTPDINNATTDQLIQAIAEHLDVPADKQTMINLHIIDKESRLWDSENIYFCEAYAILLPVYGIYPYPAFLYPHILPRENHLYSTPRVEANIAAIIIGLEEPSRRANTNPMTETDLKNLIQRLETGNYSSLETPITAPKDDTTYNFTTFNTRNIRLIAEYQLPDGWYADYLENGWKIVPEITAKHRAKHPNAAAITAYADQTIYFATGYRDYTTVAHEFTHYVVHRLGISKDTLAECYQEGRANDLNIREYGWNNSSEYIAVFMEQWLSYPNSHKRLYQQVPKTAALAQQLVDGLRNTAEH